jgi:Flp pilus assembly protein TadD
MRACVLAILVAAAPALAEPQAPPPLGEVMARAASRAGQWPAAARLWRQQTQAEPSNGQAWAGLGVALLEQGEAGDAAIALERAALLLPGDAGLWLHRGRAALALGQHEAARTAFAAFTASRPGDPRGWTGLGVAHDLAGDHAAAQTAYARALAVDPLNAAARHNLALSRAGPS